MGALTAALAAVNTVLILWFRPLGGLCIYVLATVLYPGYLTLSLGTYSISVGRVIICVLLVRCLMSSDITRHFRWNLADTILTIHLLICGLIVFCSVAFAEAIENQMGFFIDTFFVYLVARLILKRRADFVTLAVCLGITMVILGGLGLFESITGHQPYIHLAKYCSWEIKVKTAPRLGMMRALGPFSHPIMFGMFFAIFVPIVFSLRQTVKWHRGAYYFSVMAFAGAFSSLSSGPWMAAVFAGFCLFMEKRKKYVKPIVILFGLMCGLVAIVSNRPFYHVFVAYLDPLGASGWHRAKLIDLAIENIGQWFVLGYGDKDPGWGPYLGMVTTDVTNHIILLGVKYGFGGLFSFCLVIFVVFKRVIKAGRSIYDPFMRSMAWGLGCSLAVMLFASMSVSFFGQLQSLIYFVIGITAALSSDTLNRIGGEKVIGSSHKCYSDKAKV
jgi:hypothetical protein